MKDQQLTSRVPIDLPSIGRAEIKQKAKGVLKYMGLAFVVSVAYMDPGNFCAKFISKTWNSHGDELT